jgi:hypothetical protein
MPLNLRTPTAEGPAPAHSYPVTRSFAMLVLAALVLLFALRHVFGSVRLEGGVR